MTYLGPRVGFTQIAPPCTPLTVVFLDFMTEIVVVIGFDLLRSNTEASFVTIGAHQASQELHVSRVAKSLIGITRWQGLAPNDLGTQ